MRSKTFILFLLFLVLLLAAYCSGKRKAGQADETIIRTDTLTVIRRDTLVIRDTVPEKVYITRTDTLRMTTTKHDTVFIEVPISMYEFTDGKNYKARISGFRVELEEMTLFPQTMERTIKETVSDRSKRWGIGIQAGYGMTRAGLSPYVGVGICYNLFSF